MEYLAMIQARCGSTRLPQKVLMDLCGKPLLQRMIERVQRSKRVDEVMVITSIDKLNLPILKLCADLEVRVGVGSEEDVLDRYYQTAKLLKPRYVIRLTGDCPCIDPELIDSAILQIEEDTDYCSNTLLPTFADGLDLEIVRYEALEKAWREARHSFEREHVTQYILRHPELFKQKNIISPAGDFSDYRWTVDEPEDFDVARRIYEYFFYEVKKEDFHYKDILRFMESHPEVSVINGKYRRNEGLQKSIDKDVLVKPGEESGLEI